jgi:hypothetical protein
MLSCELPVDCRLRFVFGIFASLDLVAQRLAIRDLELSSRTLRPFAERKEIPGEHLLPGSCNEFAIEQCTP